MLAVWAPIARAARAGCIRTVHSVILDRLTNRLRGDIPGFPPFSELPTQPPPEPSLAAPRPLVTDKLERFTKAIRFLGATKGFRLTRRAPDTMVGIVNALWPEKKIDRDRLARPAGFEAAALAIAIATRLRGYGVYEILLALDCTP